MAADFAKVLLDGVSSFVLGKHAADNNGDLERNGRPQAQQPRKRRRLLNPSPGRANREDAVSISSSNTSSMPRPLHAELLAYADDEVDSTVPAANVQDVSLESLPAPSAFSSLSQTISLTITLQPISVSDDDDLQYLSRKTARQPSPVFPARPFQLYVRTLSKASAPSAYLPRAMSISNCRLTSFAKIRPLT
jgi:hypothetical protein